MRILVLVAAAAGSLGFGGCTKDPTDRDIARIDLPMVRRLTEPGSSGKSQAALVDPRSEKDFAAGHIPGAVNLEMSEIPLGATRVPRRLEGFKYLIVYGDDPGSGVARAVAKRLIVTGHKGVRWYEGGLGDWKANALPVETAEPAKEGSQP